MRNIGESPSFRGKALGIGLGLVLLALPAWADVRRDFPTKRPTTRQEMVLRHLGTGVSPSGSLTPNILQSLSHADPVALETRQRRSLLARSFPLARSEFRSGPGGVPIRFTLESTAIDRVDPADRDGDGTPDRVQRVQDGLAAAAELLHGQLELPRPRLSEIRLVDLQDGVDGYLVPPGPLDGRAQILLDVSPADGATGLRRAAIHEYTHAVLASGRAGVPIAWREALASWVRLRLDPAGEGPTLSLIDRQLESTQSGLPRSAAWFAFLDEAYGLSAVRLAIEELDRVRSAPEAFDRAVRRTRPIGLADAYREFQLWSTLIGARADGRHFSFAERLEAPSFASKVDGLPSLSVQSDPPLAPWGSAQVLLRPATDEGGLQVRFEGGFPARWQADLLLTGNDDSLRRIPIAIAEDGRGQLTVPLEGIHDAVLLIRNLAEVGTTPQPYSYTAHLERHYPFELSTLDAERDRRGSGVLVAWETTVEQDLIGFNIQRRPLDGERFETINPIWVPALGGETEPTSYRFLDPSAESDDGYLYRIEGVTRTGMTRRSSPVFLPPGPPSR